MPTLRHLLLPWPLVAALSACGPPAPAPAPAPPPSAPSAPAPAPGEAIPPAPAASAALADPERDAVLFTHWRGRHAAEVDAFLKDKSPQAYDNCMSGGGWTP